MSYVIVSGVSGVVNGQYDFLQTVATEGNRPVYRKAGAISFVFSSPSGYMQVTPINGQWYLIHRGANDQFLGTDSTFGAQPRSGLWTSMNGWPPATITLVGSEAAAVTCFFLPVAPRQKAPSPPTRNGGIVALPISGPPSPMRPAPAPRQVLIGHNVCADSSGNEVSRVAVYRWTKPRSYRSE